jgi:hypothetical protein
VRIVLYLAAGAEAAHALRGLEAHASRAAASPRCPNSYITGEYYRYMVARIIAFFCSDHIFRVYAH